jgi:hypothetical protein
VLGSNPSNTFFWPFPFGLWVGGSFPFGACGWGGSDAGFLAVFLWRWWMGRGGGGQALVLAAPLVVGEVDEESIQMLVLAAPSGAKC